MLRTTIHIAIIITSLLFLPFLSRGQHVHTEDDEKIIDRMHLASTEEVQSYMRETLNSEVPGDVRLEDKYVAPNNYLEASRILGQDYSFFYQKQGIDLINAVKMRPLEYREMIIDFKLLRQKYDEY